MCICICLLYLFDCCYLRLGFVFFCYAHLALLLYVCFFFFFKQKTAYEMRISDWSSDVCSSDLLRDAPAGARRRPARAPGTARPCQPQLDADLHRGRCRASDGRLPQRASARVGGATLCSCESRSPGFWALPLVTLGSCFRRSTVFSPAASTSRHDRCTSRSRERMS